VGHASTGDGSQMVDCAILSRPRVVSINDLFRHSDLLPGFRISLNSPGSVYSYEAPMNTR
jgi:hypothetical protein